MSRRPVIRTDAVERDGFRSSSLADLAAIPGRNSELTELDAQRSTEPAISQLMRGMEENDKHERNPSMTEPGM